jgi:hypothetical protein
VASLRVIFLLQQVTVTKHWKLSDGATVMKKQRPIGKAGCSTIGTTLVGRLRIARHESFRMHSIKILFSKRPF